MLSRWLGCFLLFCRGAYCILVGKVRVWLSYEDMVKVAVW